jgi:tetratricopeptide (TPR) repeat protein
MRRDVLLSQLVLVVCALGGCATVLPSPERPRTALAAEDIREGDALRRKGAWGAAADAYRRALSVDPFSVRAHVGIQVLGLRQGRDLELRRIYREGPDPFLAARLEPAGRRRTEGYAAADEPWRSLGRGWTAAERGDWTSAAWEYRRVLAMDPGLTWARLSYADALVRRRRSGEAEREYRAAAWTEPEHPAPALGLSMLEDSRGDLDGALRWALEAFERAPAAPSLVRRVHGLAARSGQRRTMREVAGRLMAHGDAGDGEGFLRAADLYRRAGDPDRAAAAADRARGKGVSEAELETLERRSLRPEFARFVRAFVRGVQGRYRHFAATNEAQSFGAFVDWARDLYTRETGRALGPKGEPQSFTLIGKLMDPGLDTDEPLVRACAAEGLLLVLGQRSGGPPEAMLSEIVRREADRVVHVRGADVTREVAWLGHRYLSGYLEWSGGGDIAGLALHGIILLDLHAMATWEGELGRRLAPLRANRERLLAVPALEDSPVSSIDDPAGVGQRLFLDGPVDFAEEVRVHEEAHLVDASLHLPVGSHPLRNLGLAVRRGFSARDIMAYLERNAQLTAIAEGPTPRTAFAVCCVSLGGASVHARGYSEIVAGYVHKIVQHPERFPRIDPERVIVQQLHLLTDAQIRSLARELVQDWGLAR